jgi:hypothetical protein
MVIRLNFMFFYYFYINSFLLSHGEMEAKMIYLALFIELKVATSYYKLKILKRANPIKALF